MHTGMTPSTRRQQCTARTTQMKSREANAVTAFVELCVRPRPKEAMLSPDNTAVSNSIMMNMKEAPMSAPTDKGERY